MKILEYSNLDLSRLKAPYLKVRDEIARDDFRSADVKKLAQSDFYRAKLDYSNRLLFKIVRYQEVVYALMLEIIENHAYEKSRFLRGATVDENKFEQVESPAKLPADLPLLPYVNPANPRFNLLDKVISFDDTQEAIYRLPPPIIVIGSAGSGKTALTLEKMKQIEGDILYVTHSAFLAQNSRNLYYANGFDNEQQNVDFFSYREFLEAIHVPAGREVSQAAFRGWIERIPKNMRVGDAHKLFEEFRGVLTGTAGDAAFLTRAAYESLGVKQSIFLEHERSQVYGLFEKYLLWLKDNALYDVNLISHEYLKLSQARYDFIVVDEVQDLTNIQLRLILRTLRKQNHFLLCGDSNQIVHPNFFSWTSVKSLFYHDDQAAAGRSLHLLQTNFRNSTDITDIANKLLTIKQKRFGSIDRESNYLVRSIASESGTIAFFPDKEAIRRELNQKTRQSTRFAVLVMRDEQKAEARQHFQTPLIFSVQEAKGLEYENIILYNFVTNDRAHFNAICEGVSARDLGADELNYARGKDKTDKSLEAYKFFINSLYVAITRAVKNLYIIEQDTGHKLLQLLDLGQEREKLDLASQASSVDEWQREARRLELQGKDEQANEIRRSILHQKAVPWEVLSTERLPEYLDKAYDTKNVSSKPRRALLDFAAFHGAIGLADCLAQAHYEPARRVYQFQRSISKKFLGSYEAKHFKDILHNVDSYGANFRNPVNHTPLMLAARAGNVTLTEALLERGADPELRDNFGMTAMHVAINRALIDPSYAQGPFGAIFARVALPGTSIQVDDRLIKIDAHLSEFMLFHAMLVLLKQRIHNPEEDNSYFGGVSTKDYLDGMAHFPDSVFHQKRVARQYLSSVLSRNEVDRDYAYNRKLFLRMAQGHYVINPQLSLRVGESWQRIYDVFNLPFAKNNPHPHSKWFVERLSWVAEGNNLESFLLRDDLF